MTQENRGLTPKQKQVLEFINEYSEANGYAPAQSEIANHFGFKSLGTVQEYLVNLERKGCLSRPWNARRGLQVVPLHPPCKAVPLPLLGRVAAGRPIEAIETDETLEVPASMIGPGDHFVLKVSGQSMIEDGIFDGDYVVVKRQADAKNGQTVVAIVGNEATIKRYYHRDGQIELHPANPAFEPMIIPSLIDGEDSPGLEFKIRGVMVGLIRRTA